MKLTLILIALSIAALIIAIVYSTSRKNSDNNSPVKQKSDKIHHNSSKNIASIFDIQIIENFIRSGNRYSCVLKLGSIDYNMLSDDEQETIEMCLFKLH